MAPRYSGYHIGCRKIPKWILLMFGLVIPHTKGA